MHLSNFLIIEEFENYKTSPEYQRVNFGIELSAFKGIFLWEYVHRILGRITGLVFLLPLIFSWATRKFNNSEELKYILAGFLFAMQGFIGWWMVKSGLVDRVDVSQYRLVTHLTLACIIFAYAFWIARGLAPHSTQEQAPLTLRVLAPLVSVFVLVQIFLGGLVAGLDAGLAAKDWPKMLGEWIPGDISDMSPLWLNWFENPISVQFNHRISAYVLLAVILFQWWAASGSRAEAPHKRRTFLIVLVAFVQAIIGILTVIWEVPLNTALAHQGVAVLLLAFVVAHWRGLVGPYAPVTAFEIRG